MNVEVDAENPPTPGESAPSTPRSSNLQQPSAADTSAATSNPGSKGQTPCKFFFSKRGCAYGSECKFSHSPRAQPEKTARDARDEHVRERREASKPPVCRHYLSSAGCKYGDKCRYHHPAEEDSARGEGGTGASEDVEQTLSEDLQMRAHITPLGRGRYEGSRVDEFPHDVREDMSLLSLTRFPGLNTTASRFYQYTSILKSICVHLSPGSSCGLVAYTCATVYFLYGTYSYLFTGRD